METKEIFVYQWILDPHETEKIKIRIYGIDSNQKTVCLKINNFKTCCYIQLPNSSPDTVQTIQTAIEPFITSFNLVNKHHLYNTHNHSENINENGMLVKSKTAFLQTYFESFRHMQQMLFFLKKGINIRGKQVFLETHETNVNPILQFVCACNIDTSGWIQFQTKQQILINKDTSCDEEYIVRWQHLEKGKNSHVIYPKILSFDIEVNSSIETTMPSDRPDDAIFQISCVIIEKDKQKRKLLLSLQPNTDSDYMINSLKEINIETRLFKSERDLLIDFINLIEIEKPNAITGFNIFGFDLEYSMKRAKRFHLCDDFKLVSFYKTMPATEEEIKWSSSAYKNQSFKFINWEGILLVDLLPIIQRDYKLDTYTLKNVSSTLLNNNTKDPVTHKDIFKSYREREPKLLTTVGKYCVQDSDLCIELMNHLHTWVSLSEMAKCCNVPMFVLFTQGQQIRIFSTVYRYCRENNIIVTTNGYEAKIDERYRGALVYEPEPGYYKNVCPLDFASLYPSIIIGYNLCYSTFVPQHSKIPDKYCNVFTWEDHVGCEHDDTVVEIKALSEKISVFDVKIKDLRKIRDTIKIKDLPPGTTKESKKAEIQKKIDVLVLQQKPLREKRQTLKKSKPKDKEDAEGNKISGILCAKRHYRFLKAEIYKGVVPTIIQNLLDSRAKVKQAMKTCPEEQKIVYDKEQLSYKVSANSFYGSFGVTRGYLAFMPCAMTITYCGRQAISKVIELATQNFKAKLVMSDTDSTYLVFPEEISSNPKQLWDYASLVANQITNWKNQNNQKIFPEAIKLEFENIIYSKFLILAKKMYLYKSIGPDGVESEKIGKKGVLLARRDNSQAVRTVYEYIANLIFEEKSLDEMCLYLQTYVYKMYNGELPISDFVITKSIGETDSEHSSGKLGDYKIRHDLPDDPIERKKILGHMNERQYYISQCPPQVQLAEKMKNRGIPVSSGSRIEFVVTKKPGAVSLGQKMESYDYFVKHKNILYIDYKYYSTALINPITQLFNAVTKENIVENLINKINQEEYEKEMREKPILIWKK